MYEEIFEKLNELDEDYLIEMAVASKNDTGLQYDLWLDKAGHQRNVPHNSPRIKVKIGNDLIPVLISDNPDVPYNVKKNNSNWNFRGLSDVKKYIIKYKDVLTDYWNGKLTDKDVLNLLGDLKDNNIPGQLSLFND